MVRMTGRRAIGAATRETILQAACRVIARDGGQGLHTSTVAVEAGVSKALVHYHFETRLGLLERALAYADRKAQAEAEAELELLPTGRARLERVLLRYATGTGVFASVHAVWTAAWGSLAIEPALTSVRVDVYRNWLEWVARLVEEGSGDGSLRRGLDASAVALRLAALAEGHANLTGVGVVTPDAAEETVLEAVAAYAP